MRVLLWLSRILAVCAALLALILALSHTWGGAGQSLFLAVLLWVVGERFAAGRQKSPIAPAPVESTNKEEG